MAKPITQNTLFYGDNLDILREYIPDESIDLIYLDPPFNSKRSYNVLFKNESGKESQAQITAFDDTWHWDTSAEETYHAIVTTSPNEVAKMISALRDFIGTNQMMAYLVMMTIRLVELHRVLKPTGSLYLHCDTTASHYLKIVLDTIFGFEFYRNEITWKRSTTHSDAKKFASISDIIFYYVKSKKHTWNSQRIGYSDAYIDKYYNNVDENGHRFSYDNLTKPKGSIGYFYVLLGCEPPPNGWRMPQHRADEWVRDSKVAIPPRGKKPRYKRYLTDVKGVTVSDIWGDIPPINSQAKERLGYPTQKPLALLERIIEASSNAGDIILDPFCGCGTAIAAAEKLGRQWVGIDITHLSVALQKYRLQDMFPDIEFDVVGEPETVGAARYLAEQDRFQFEWWALSLVRAKPTGGSKGSKRGKKGADQGIDGIVYFIDTAKGEAKQVLVQVKSGKVSSRDIRDLVGTVDREKAVMGVFITLEESSRPMRTEAVSAGYYHSQLWDNNYPKIQILTIGELLAGEKIKMPPAYNTFQRASVVKEEGEQLSLL